MSSVLLVDDEPGVLFTLQELLTERGHRVLAARSGPEALGKLEEAETVVTDLAMPGMDGLELLAQIAARDPELPVILLTAHGSERVAVAAMKQGAYDYVAKPFDIDEVAVVIERALEARRLRIDNRRLAAEQTLGRRIVGGSRPMRRLLEATSRIATRDVTVLVRGETGTGKEFVAELLHAQSPRAQKPLVRFNCAALPPELADAELFRHVRGAFTGIVDNNGKLQVRSYAYVGDTLGGSFDPRPAVTSETCLTVADAGCTPSAGKHCLTCKNPGPASSLCHY